MSLQQIIANCKKTYNASKTIHSQPVNQKIDSKQFLQTKPCEKNKFQPSSTVSSNSVDKKAKITKKHQLKNGIKFIVILPLIMDSDYKPIKQPFLFKFDEDQLIEFGFSLPFDKYFDNCLNNFIFEVGRYKMNSQIIAIGGEFEKNFFFHLINLFRSTESAEAVRMILKKNLEVNPLWKNLKKIIGNKSIVIKLLHEPLDHEEAPTQLCLSSRNYNLLIEGINSKSKLASGKEKEINHHEDDEITPAKRSKPSSVHESERNPEKDISLDRDDHDDEVDNSHETKNERLFTQRETTDFRELQRKADSLDEKLCFLSDKDILSSTMKLTIEIVQNLVAVVIKKGTNGLSKEVYTTVPLKDETFTRQNKNQIYIEGKLQLDLDKYKRAMSKVKSKDPGSIVYQLVNTAFPECYWRNSTLGKKYLEACEVDKFLKVRENVKEKLPLVFKFGFKDPYNHPLEGEFDQLRGQKRVQALINHSFRKADVMQYDDLTETRVRNRLTKELWTKNDNLLNSKKKKDSIQKTKYSQDVADEDYLNITDGDEENEAKQTLSSEDSSDSDLIDYKLFD